MFKAVCEFHALTIKLVAPMDYRLGVSLSRCSNLQRRSRPHRVNGYVPPGCFQRDSPGRSATGFQADHRISLRVERLRPESPSAFSGMFLSILRSEEGRVGAG